MTGDEKAKASAESRLNGGNPFGDGKFTARDWAVLDALRGVAAAAGRSPALVALAWAAQRPGITALVVGASGARQLADNIASLDVRLDPAAIQALDEASAPEPVYPYPIFTPMVNRMVFGGTSVTRWRP